eukprot:TRINITY_DN22367_c0_g1_i1.p1 TRINITY_DN22367_c0_g1~~TRINITY_DN22367_c0_g1_i1.p1  ORF type:complete len:587 (+),score=116.91 TRINITY_DN22367_c0_g1_i1:49-1809(+)
MLSSYSWSFLFILSAVFRVACSDSACHEENLTYNGESASVTNARTALDCQVQCDNTRCSYWTWLSGKCELKRIAKPGDKVPKRGAISGAKSSKSCDKGPAKAVPCKYTDTKEEILCVFPFVGENPGQKSGGSTHENCLKTKKGHYWCATRLNLDNRVLSTSVQNRDVDCGQRVNSKNELLCSPPGSAGLAKATTTKPTTTTKKESETSRSSCFLRCGKPAGAGECQCNKQCFAFGDCCSDYTTTCQVSNPNTCSGKCGAKFQRGKDCQCNVGCEKFKNCCPDYIKTCPATPTTKPAANPAAAASASSNKKVGVTLNGVSDMDLRTFSEDLLASDEDNVARLVEVDTGCTTRVGRPTDCSRNPLFSKIDTSILRKPVYEKLIALYENYDSDVAVKEDRTRAEQTEEDAFLSEIMKSKVMTKTLSFLKSKQLFTKSSSEFRKLLKELWFDVYSRGKRILGSSGFEHVFLGEKKAGKVQGFHNWVYFQHLEKKNELNYLGHWEKVDLGGKGTGLSFTFKWGEEQKPFASMLVGTSPEFELALYTTCLLARGDEKCSISLGGQPVAITTHVFTRPGGVRYIASSFMDWKP